MKQIINGMVYDTEAAQLIADNKYWDGSNWDRRGRSNSLFKTKKGNFFILFETRWQGERDAITPMTQLQAEGWFEKLPEVKVEFPAAFGHEPEIA